MRLETHGGTTTNKHPTQQLPTKDKGMKRENGNSDLGALIGLGLVAWVIASWLTHVIVCIKAASWGFLIAGAIFFPVAVIHGTGVWFGAW